MGSTLGVGDDVIEGGFGSWDEFGAQPAEGVVSGVDRVEPLAGLVGVSGSKMVRAA